MTTTTTTPQINFNKLLQSPLRTRNNIIQTKKRQKKKILKHKHSHTLVRNEPLYALSVSVRIRCASVCLAPPRLFECVALPQIRYNMFRIFFFRSETIRFYVFKKKKNCFAIFLVSLAYRVRHTAVLLLQFNLVNPLLEHRCKAQKVKL